MSEWVVAGGMGGWVGGWRGELATSRITSDSACLTFLNGRLNSNVKAPPAC